MNNDTLDWGAWVLIILPIVNIFFVRDGYRKYRSDPGHSRLLLAFWIVKLVMWLFGIAFAIFAARYLWNQPPFPFGGISLIIIVFIVELLPATIYFILSTYRDK